MPSSSSLRWASLPLATVLLAGCATLPKRSDLPAPATAQSHASTRSLASAGGEWPSDGWWKQFGDAQLDALITEGLAKATDLRVAEARFAQASALTGQAESQLLPQLNAGTEGGAIQSSDNFLIPKSFAPRGWPDYGQVSLSFNWQLDFWGRNRAALAAARSEAESARAEAAAARLAVSTGIAAAYADLAALYASRDAAESAVSVRRQTYNLMTQRQAQGLENTGAVEQVRSALAMTEGELASTNEALALTCNRIAALTGAGPDRGLDLARPALPASANTALPAEIPATLLGRRPDVIAARLRAEAAASRIRSARAAFYPNINLAGVVGYQALGLDTVFKSTSDFGTVGPALTLPIFSGGRLRSQYRAAEAEYTAAVGQYDGALVQALREVADAATSQRALSERLASARAAEQAAQTAWTIASTRYRGGLATYLDVLAAEDALIASRRTLATLQTRAFALDVALIRALGGGYKI